MDFDWREYLRRISFDGAVSVDSTSLVRLHQRQIRTMAFENFDILLGRPIELHPARLWQKLVENQRGGYCFELNGLLLMALRAFGFEARALLAHIHVSGTPEALRTHQLSLVTLEGEDWLVDVGFGSTSPRAPVRLTLDLPQQQETDCLRVVTYPNEAYLLQSLIDGEWQDQYSFHLDVVEDADIQRGNQYTSTDPKSFFTHTGVAALQHEQGRTALSNYSLRDIVDGQETLSTLAPGALYVQALEEKFGLKIDAAFDDINLPKTAFHLD